jgi:predicted SnoaL-like aldol condensation-catalyzing enzyme
MNSQTLRALGLSASLLLTACGGSEDPGPALSPDAGVTMTNAQRAVAALEAAFVTRDPAAVDLHWGDYIAHNPYSAANGAGFLKSGISQGYFANLKWTRHRTIAQGDLVAVHSTYEGMPSWPAKAVVFDLLRFDPSTHKVVEHWDCMQADPGRYVSGRVMTDGPSAADTTADAAVSRSVVLGATTGVIPVVFMGHAFDRLAEFFSPDYAQHNPLAGDGLAGLSEAMGKAPLNSLAFVAPRQEVVEGDLVFVRSLATMSHVGGEVEDQPTILCDLMRVAGGKVVEHWDVIQAIPGARAAEALPRNGAGNETF